MSPADGIDWTFETTMGWQNLGNMLMSKEGSSSTQSKEPLYFYGILYHAYYEKLPMLKAQMNLGFDELISFYWSTNPDFNHDDQLLNEKLRCIEVDVQWPLPSLRGIYGQFFPYVGYSYMNYSYAESYSSYGSQTFSYHAFSAGIEYSRRISKNFSHNYYYSFAPIMLNNTGKQIYSYSNYGLEIIANYSPVAITFFMGFRNGYNETSKLFNKTTYTFSNSEVGISFHTNLN